MSNETSGQIRETTAALLREFNSYQSAVASRGAFGTLGIAYGLKAEYSEQTLSNLIGRMDRFLKSVLTSEELTIVHKALFLDHKEPQKASLVRRAGTLIARFAGTIESRTDEELQGTPPSWFLDPQKANSASFTTNNFFHGAVSGGVNTAESIMVDDNSRKQ